MTIVRLLIVFSIVGLVGGLASACGPPPGNDPSKLGNPRPQPISIPQ